VGGGELGGDREKEKGQTKNHPVRGGFLFTSITMEILNSLV